MRIALPTLANILLNNAIKVHEDVHVETFLETVSNVEAGFLKKILEVCEEINNFSKKQIGRVSAILSRFDYRQYPTPQSLRRQVIQCAHYEFLVKPSAAGIPLSHKPFWKNLPVDEFCTIFQVLTASPNKIAEAIRELIFSNGNQEWVFNYLVEYVGDMNLTDVQRFLRFTTGSLVCLAKPILVEFNNCQSELARLPTGQTCSCTILLPASYTTYMDFVQDFQAILQVENSWFMDAI